MVQRASGVVKFGADGKWLGALKGGTYFSASVDPGEHHLCTIGQLRLWKGLHLHELTAKADETYYSFVHIVAGRGLQRVNSHPSRFGRRKRVGRTSEV